MAANKDLIIYQGKTYAQVVRWESLPVIYKAITGVTNAAPAAITATTHGIPPGWRVAVTAVKGMKQINALNSPPKDKDYHIATVIDSDHITLNDVNSALYGNYLPNTGYVQYNTPVDLTGFTARMSIKDKIGGVELLRLDTATVGIIVDVMNFAIDLSISATLTAAITWIKGVYDLELVSATGVVTALLSGTVTVVPEVTTT